MKINTNACTNFNQFDNQVNQLYQISETELHEQASNVCLFMNKNIHYIQNIQIPETTYKLKSLLDKITIDFKPDTIAYQDFNRIVDVVNRTLPMATAVTGNEGIHNEEIPIVEAIRVDFFPNDTHSEASAPSIAPPAINPAYEQKPFLNTAKDWSKIQKEQENKLNPKWYEKEKIRGLATKILAGLSVVFTGLTYGAGFLFTANPYTVLGTTAFFAACTVCSAIASYFSSPGGKDFLRDPEVLVRKGKEAEADIVDSKEPKLYQYIAKKYALLLENNVLTNEHLNRLFHQRIASDLPYEDLRNLLESPNSPPFTFGFTLSSENRDILKAKALAPSWGKEELMSKEEIQVLGIPPDLIAKRVTDKTYSQLLRKEIPYSTFAKDISTHWDRFDSNQLQQIKPLAIAYYVQSHQSVKSALDEINRTKMNISLIDLIQHGILSHDINEMIAGRLSYTDFREKHLVDAIQQHQVSSDNQVEKDAVKTSYLRDYRTMHDFKGDAKMLGINDIDAKLKTKFQEELQQIRSLDEIGQRLGYSVFEENLLKKETPFLKKLVLEQLKKDSYHVPTSSILKTYDLLSGDIQQKIQVALEQEAQVVEGYQSGVEKANYEFTAQKAQYGDLLAAGQRSQLDPVIRNLNNVRSKLSQATAKAEKYQTTITEYKIAEVKRDENSKLLRLAKQSLETVETKEKLIGTSQPGKLDSLKREQEELRRKGKRKEEVSSLLKSMKEIPEIEAKIGNFKREIQSVEQKIGDNPQVRGVINAVAIIQLKTKKTKLEGEKKELQLKLDAAQSLIPQRESLEQELTELGNVDAKLLGVSKSVEQTEEQDELTKQKKKFNDEIYSLENSPQNHIFAQGLEMFYRLQLKTDLTKLNEQIAALRAEESQCAQSVTIIETKLNTEYDVSVKLAESTLNEKEAQLTIIKDRLFVKIREQFQTELKTLT